jgi:hypothetical protein
MLSSLADDLKTIPEAEESAVAYRLKQLGIADASQVTVGLNTIVPDCTYYGFIKQVGSGGAIQFEQAQFFTGQAAKDACTQDRVPTPWNTERCNDYYIRDLHSTSTLNVSGSAQISSWQAPDGSVQPGTPISYSQLASLTAQSKGSYFYRLTVRGGKIVAARMPGAACSGDVAVDYGQELIDVERLAEELGGAGRQEFLPDTG